MLSSLLWLSKKSKKSIKYLDVVSFSEKNFGLKLKNDSFAILLHEMADKLNTHIQLTKKNDDFVCHTDKLIEAIKNQCHDLEIAEYDETNESEPNISQSFLEIDDKGNLIYSHELLAFLKSKKNTYP